MGIQDWITEAIGAAAGANLSALLIYGPLSDPEGDAVKALSTLVIVLEDASSEALKALNEPLQEATRRAHVTPFVLRRDEVGRLLDALPLRALTIRNQAVVLHGENPFADVVLDREHVRLRVEQECRNLLVRLRHDICLSSAAGHRLKASLWRTVRAIGRVLEGLWFLKHGDKTHPSDLWEPSIQDWDLPSEQTRALATFGTSESASNMSVIGDQAIQLLEILTERVDRLEV